MPQDEKNNQPKSVTNRNKKPLTPAQKKLRYDIRRFSILGGLGVAAIGILVLAIFLISLPFRLLFNSNDEEASTLDSQYVESTPSTVVSAEPEPSTVTLMAVGDNLIHSTIIEYGLQEDGTYDFTDIYSYILDDIETADLACIQQETIFVTDPAEYTNYPAFGTPAEMADSLASVGFDVICHASNHTYDKWMIGMNDTFAAWKKHTDVTVLGIHETQEHADTIQVVEKNGIKIAMLDYTYGLNYTIPEDEYVIDFLWEERKDIIQQQLQEAKSLSDIVIVFMHCGTEDSLEPDSTQQDWAQFFADNGVGLVIGTHPHVIQPTDEIIGSSGNVMPIFYSLGNFVSSQRDTVNMLGGMANVTITKDSSGTYVSEYSMSPIVTWIQDGGTNGSGYIFHSLHLEDYTDEMGLQHIRDNCMPADFQSIWDTVMTTPAEDTEDSTLTPAA